MTHSILSLLRFISLIILFSGCSSYSLDDFREEGDGITKALIAEFQHIRTKEELAERSERLHQLFDELVNVMIQAEEFRKAHPQAFLTARESTLSDKLRTEMNRILSIEGTREILERIQEFPLNRLDGS